MPLDPKQILSHAFAARPVSYRAEDAILYALCCGAGADGDLAFVYENGLRVVPSFGQNLCFDDSWMGETGIDLSRVVHAGLDLTFHRPFGPQAEVSVESRIAGLTDKGEGRPALILHQSDVIEKGEVVFTSRSNMFVMGGGGFGGSIGEAFETPRPPERPADRQIELAARPDSPLFFRLLGDRNPLHVLPEAARAAGFERPIMHGANTFGLVCHAIVQGFCDGDPARLKRFAARFSGPLFPGEHLELSCWTETGGLRFAARSVERQKPVLDGGLARID